MSESAAKRLRKAQAKRKTALEIDKRDRAKIRGKSPHTINGGLPTLGKNR